MNILLGPLTVALIVAVVLTPIVRNWMIARGWVEKPTEKQKKSGNATALYPIPRGCGVAIYIAMVTAVLIFAGGQGKIIGIMIAGLLMLLV